MDGLKWPSFKFQGLKFTLVAVLLARNLVNLNESNAVSSLLLHSVEFVGSLDISSQISIKVSNFKLVCKIRAYWMTSCLISS